MSRYIDLDRLLEHFDDSCKYKIPINDYQRGCNQVFDWFVLLIMNSPIIDAIPSFEVESLYAENERLLINMNAYALAAKRLQEDVECLQEDVERLQDINNRQVGDVRLAKQEVVREIFAELDGITDLFAKGLIGELEMYDMLAELKNKYLEVV